MVTCSNCNSFFSDDSKFCQQCGFALPRLSSKSSSSSFSYSPFSSYSRNSSNQTFNDRPIVFTVFLAINYFVVLLLGLNSFSALFFGSRSTTYIYENGSYRIFSEVSYIAGIYSFIILFGFTLLFFKLVQALQHYSNNARLFMIFLLFLNLLSDFLAANIFGLLFDGFGFYVLLLHRPTVDLF